MLEVFLWVLAVIVAGVGGYFFGGLHAASIAVSAFKAEYARFQERESRMRGSIEQLRQDLAVERMKKESSYEGQ